MAKIDHIPDEPSLADLVLLFKRLHDCMEQRFDEASKERAEVAEQVRTDRHASRNRDMVLDGGLDRLRETIDQTGTTLTSLQKTQLSARAMVNRLASGQVALNGAVKAAAEKAATAADRADAVGEKVQEITVALGLTGDKPKPVALWSPQRVLMAVSAGGTTLFFFAKIADALWPFMLGFAHGFPGVAWGIVKALWHAAIR